MNLLELLNDLEAKAKAATLPKIIACPKCDSTSPPDWAERSPDGDSQCSSCKKPSANWAWVKQEPSPFRPNPETVLALITALREAREVIENVTKPIEKTVYRYSSMADFNDPPYPVTEIIDKDDAKYARAFLEKWGKNETT